MPEEPLVASLLLVDKHTVYSCPISVTSPLQLLNGRVGEVNRYIHDVSRPWE